MSEHRLPVLADTAQALGAAGALQFEVTSLVFSLGQASTHGADALAGAAVAVKTIRRAREKLDLLENLVLSADPSVGWLSQQAA